MRLSMLEKRNKAGFFWSVFRLRKGFVIPFFIATFLFSFFIQLPAFSQTGKVKLENKRKSIQNEISLANKLLEETRSLKDQSLGELKLLHKQILLRQELLGQLKMGIKDLEKEIEQNTLLIETLQKDLDQIKKQYADLVFSTYKTLSGNNELLYVLSAENLNQAQARIRYFKELAAYHKSQAEMIRRTQAYLVRKKLELEEIHLQKTGLMEDEKREGEKLKINKSEKDKLLVKLKKDEDKHRKTIKEKQLALHKINRDIEELIAKEMKVSPGARDILLPLSKEFAENRGKMPWPLPTGNGVITTGFGINEDESGLQVNNTGVDIVTSEGQAIRAIFDGKVAKVQAIPTFGKVLIVQHGAYYTVYAHLAHTFVEEGEQIKKLQDIGIAKTDKTTGETKVHFQVFQSKTPMNPEDWLVGKK